MFLLVTAPRPTLLPAPPSVKMHGSSFVAVKQPQLTAAYSMPSSAEGNNARSHTLTTNMLSCLYLHTSHLNKKFRFLSQVLLYFVTSAVVFTISAAVFCHKCCCILSQVLLYSPQVLLYSPQVLLYFVTSAVVFTTSAAVFCHKCCCIHHKCCCILSQVLLYSP